MKRNLLRQMRNEWRDNLWLVVELIVVFAAIWGLSVLLYSKTMGLREPMGVDPEDVYCLSTRYILSDNPNYIAPDTLGGEPASSYGEDLRQIVRALRENPNVEAVGIHNDMVPYQYNYYGTMISEFDKNDSIGYSGNRRTGSAEMVKVLGVKSLTGLSQDQLMKKMCDGEILISNNRQYEDQGRDPKSLIGKTVIFYGDSSVKYRVGDVVQIIRRTEYEPAWQGGFIVPIKEDTEIKGDVALKLKPGRERQFKEDFKNNEELRKYRNVYLSDLKSLMDIRETCQRNDDVNVRVFVSLMFFLLVTVFLGLMGTFWFRLKQRVGEIAIRKVCGARKGDIFRRIISEGMILLVCAVIVLSALIWPFIETFENIMFVGWKTFLIGEIAAFVIVAAGIVVSLWYPAKKAMDIEPAIAIKSE